MSACLPSPAVHRPMMSLIAGLHASLLGGEVTQVGVYELQFEITPPLQLPAGHVRTRDYVVLELRLASGGTGTAYVMTRGRAHL